MSYEIFTQPNYVHVRLYDDVHTMDLLEAHNQTSFLTGLGKSTCVIYDYSDAQRVLIDNASVEQLAQLANFTADLKDNVHLIIVPANPNEKSRALLYQQSVKTKSWRVSIADSFAEAQALANNPAI